jgi:excisionase family DNA binding protein
MKEQINGDRLLSRKEAAEFLGVTKTALEAWAHYGKPKLNYTRCGRLAKYKLSDLQEFIEKRTANSSREHAARESAAAK